MRKVFAAAAVLMCAMVLAQAQNAPEKPAERPAEPKPRTIKLQSYGGTARDAVESFAASLQYSCTFDSNTDLEAPVWMYLEGAGVESARCALELAMGSTRTSIVVNDKTRSVKVYGATPSESHGKSRVYEVSALCSRYVEYVNKYAPPQKPAQPKPGEANQPLRPKCAADYLADLIGEAALYTGGMPMGWSAVGNRILGRANDSDDERIRDLLRQLIAEVPGDSQTLVAEREMLAKLEKPVSIEGEERPAASFVIEIARKAGVNVVLAAEIAAVLGEAHISASSAKGADANAALKAILREHDGAMMYRKGCLAIATSERFGSPTQHIFVYEVEPLLAKLARAYEAQRTAPGREGGYQGSLRDEGGMDVVTVALADHFDPAGPDTEPIFFYSFGSRLVAVGSMNAGERVVEVLKGLGWEDPKGAAEETHGR